MGAIVLSYVVESVTGTDLYNLVRKYILDPCDMKDTVLVIRPEDMGRVVSNNYERRIANNNYCVIRDISKGMVMMGRHVNWRSGAHVSMDTQDYSLQQQIWENLHL